MAKQEPQNRERAEGPDPGRPECDSGVGRKDATGITNVYPASGPLPSGDARLQPQGTWGQADRGPEGAQDSGNSEIIPSDRLARGTAEEEAAQRAETKKS